MQNKKLNICIITGDFPSLTETFVTNKVLELQRRGHQVTVIKNSGGGSVNESHLEQVKRSGIDVTTIHDLSTLRKTANVLSRHSGVLFSSLSTSRSHLKTRLRANLQAKLLTAKPFDIIHFEFSGLAISWMNAIKKVGAKTVVSCRGTAEKVKPISDSKRKEDLKKLFAVVDAIHCVSQDMAQTIMPFCNSPEKIFVNRPSIDAELFKRTKPTPVNAIVTILTIGRFTFQKGYLPALMAVNEFKK